MMNHFVIGALFVLIVLDPAPSSQDGDTVLDFANTTLPAGWQTHHAKIEGGQLRGEGPGALTCTKPLPRGHAITLDFASDGKANLEVKLLDARGKSTRYTMAFLGRYHPVLDKVAFAILRDDEFVHVNPRLWLYPGRTWHLEVRAVRNQVQMFVDGELGGVFVDDEAEDTAGCQLRIEWTTEGKKDAVKVDNFRLAAHK